ncbi:MAG TPA: hypothetical protein PKO07_11835, partial [Pseudomonadota bacterium]|nr:hypothetical protein [Pseudomonadota bacterium]
GGVLLSGPVIGLSPEPGQPLILCGAFGQPQRVRLAGLFQTHRGSGPAQPGFVVTGLDDAAPACYRGAVLYEEGVLFRSFGALEKSRSKPRSYAARFDLGGDKAYGLVTIAGGVLDAFVIGGGLAERENLWSRLETIVAADGMATHCDALSPIGPGWPVSGWRGYAQHEHTVLIARSCGPAEPGCPIRIALGSAGILAEVLSQQPKEGIVQVETKSDLPTPPSYLMVDRTSFFDGYLQN